MTIKTLFYIDEESLSNERDSTRYVMNKLAEHPDFNVSHTTQEKPEESRDYDVIFSRFDIPLRKTFLKNLSEIQKSNPEKLFINPPESVLENHTKEYLARFKDSDILPETEISSNYKILADFAHNLESKLVSKPIDQNKGKGIEFIDPTKMSYSELEEMAYKHTKSGSVKHIYQKMINNVEYEGDKRINVVFYNPVSAVVRHPAKGSYICNVSQGGKAQNYKLNSRDHEIIEEVTPFMQEYGLLWCGMDIIKDKLIEINVVSPGLFLKGDEYCYGAGTQRLIENLRRYFG